jgi:hypothetical protein
VHYAGGRFAEGVGKVIEILEVGFVDGITNDFNIEVVKVGGRKTVAKVRC